MNVKYEDVLFVGMLNMALGMCTSTASSRTLRTTVLAG